MKERYRSATSDILQYLLIDGAFHGAVLGHFKNGPYVLEDIVVDGSYTSRQEEILEAVVHVNDPACAPPACFMGQPI